MAGNWIEVNNGQRVGFSQGWAINLLARKYSPVKIEMGWVEDVQAYRLTLYNGKVAVYKDEGKEVERCE